MVWVSTVLKTMGWLCWPSLPGEGIWYQSNISSFLWISEIYITHKIFQSATGILWIVVSCKKNRFVNFCFVFLFIDDFFGFVSFLLYLVSFRFVSLRFCFILFRFCCVSFRLVSFLLVSFRFVSFLFRFLFYNHPLRTVKISIEFQRN